MNFILLVLLKDIKDNKYELDYKRWQQIFDGAVPILRVQEPNDDLDIWRHEYLLIL
jgi:hypothetical protein